MIRCEDGRSQGQNKEKALQILRARLYELKLREQQELYSPTAARSSARATARKKSEPITSPSPASPTTASDTLPTTSPASSAVIFRS